MFQASSFSRIDEQKEVVQKELSALHEKLQTLEDDLEDDEEEDAYFVKYEALSVQIHKLKKELTQLRLRGGQFRLASKQTLEVSSDGQLVWCKEKRSLEPQVPPDMSKLNYCRLEIDIDEHGREVFVTRLSTVVEYAENIRSIRKCEADDLKKWKGREIILDWRKGRSPVVVLCADEEQQQELELVLGCQVQKHSRAKLQQVEGLRKVWRQMQTPYSAEEHGGLLEELWERVFPDEKLEGLVSSQWSKIGFQGKNPGTDFRGTGLLGLHTLLYMARHHVEIIRQTVLMEREYPFATACINVTFALTTRFLGLKGELMKHAPSSSAWNSPMLTFLCNADVEGCFEETFCQFMLVLDATFADMKAGYMDFPHVMARATRQMEDLLARRPLSLKQLQAWIQTEVLFIHGSTAATAP